MGTNPRLEAAVTPKHAEYNARVLKENQAHFEEEIGFEDPVTGNNGWIAPNGKLWPVPFEMHSEFCDLWLDETEEEVEKTYVKLSAGSAHWYGKRLTPRQEKTLFAYGYDVEALAGGGHHVFREGWES